MPFVTYQDKNYEIAAQESVLDTLLRHEVDIPYACKAGVCQVCVMVCEQGSVDLAATDGLEDIQIDNGYFFTCQCHPTESLTIRDADENGLFSQARVVEKSILSADVCRIRLKTATKLYYRAGQFLNIRMQGEHIRSYSLASLPIQDDFLELHIKRMKNGQMSNWLFNDVQPHDVLEIQGPFGECFYQPGQLDSNILMIATGTGLTPLMGILREAIESGHKGKISLYHGDSSQSGLYLHKTLKALASENSSIDYYPCVSTENDGCDVDIYKGRASEQAFTNHVNLEDSLVYLCGSPEMVDSAQLQALACGAAASRIFADPFVTKDLRLGKER